MTALCVGGGTSSVQPNAPATAAMTAAFIDVILTQAGVPWLIPFVTYLEAPLLNLTTLCATDPPPYVAFTVDEVLAFQAPLLNSNFPSALAKFQNLVKLLAWYAFCQCDAGAQPAAPSALQSPPAGTPVVVDATPGLCVVMKQAECHVLNLWNGATNNAPPANWDLPGFDDSAWPLSSDPSFGGYHFDDAGGTRFGINPQCLTPYVCAPPGIAPWVNTASGKEQFLVRWRWTMPDVDPSQLCVRIYSNFVSPGAGGFSSGLINIDGHGQFVALNGLNWKSQVGYLTAGPHLMAIWVNSGNSTPANTWGATGEIGLALTRSGVLGGNSDNGCCPPDPAVLQLLHRVDDLVTIIQRQGVPFAYVQSTVHVNIHDHRFIGLTSPIVGMLVQVTTLPDNYGRTLGTVDVLFDLGRMTVGNEDGWWNHRRIDNETVLWFPKAAGAATMVGFDLAPGVHVTATELVREP